ncbi:hypothetical protein [Brachybacterium kimchii]|uniref:Primosomal protein n=1 Tax=Brachybacterium kimchii TaxID=2942909 RepID=A0ABY4NC39_9MICO|nr:hypothetical protein [Brachybacterium kimchii]UQN31009.1 hypothetical protein M4486_06905 [Brachybacterium kimchii]
MRRDDDRRGPRRDDDRRGPRRYDDRRGPRHDRDQRGGGRFGGPRDSSSQRPGEARRSSRPPEPALDEAITGRELDRDISDELRSLRKETAERTSRHLVAAIAALDEDDLPLALAHAQFAASIGGRVGITREIYGIAAYRSEEFRTAAREFRTAMRISGRVDLLPMLADCERGIGRPERALEIAASDDASTLDVSGTIELMIVVAGAYADTGDIETALGTLDIPALRSKVDGRWQVRLWVAYADLLERAGRGDEAHRWLTLAADADTDHETDAAERLGRPVPEPEVEDLPWDDSEELSVLDAFDDSEDVEESDDSEEQEDGASESDATGEDDPSEADAATSSETDPDTDRTRDPVDGAEDDGGQEREHERAELEDEEHERNEPEEDAQDEAGESRDEAAVTAQADPQQGPRA